LHDRRKTSILKALKQSFNVYIGRGHEVEEIDFNKLNNPVHTILADNEFESPREKIESYRMRVNVTCKEEHVPEFERQFDETWAQKQIEFLKAKYEDVAVEMGDEI
jgi:hypothetical protein